ncbi:MAG: hypothetical protein ACYSUX_07425 [Planctomycetota bacterium]|jgi:hypothetical protein
MNEIIEKLKNKKYVRAFGLMSEEEREVYRKAGRENCDLYGINGNWIDDKMRVFYNHETYAIKPDYQSEPEYVDLEIKKYEQSKQLGCKIKWLGVFDRDAPFELPHYFTHLHCLPSLENFEKFWIYGGFGKKLSVSILFTEVATRMNEGKTVYARMWRDK